MGFESFLYFGLRRFRFASHVSDLHELIYNVLNYFITRKHLSHIVVGKQSGKV